MKTITLSAAAMMLLGTLTLGMAADLTVDEQITAIQEAPAEERVQLMNQFKIRLATMNKTEREAAITQLRTQTQTRERLNEHKANPEAELAKTRTMTQERSRVNEMQETQQMQLMNQHQIRHQQGTGAQAAPRQAQ